MVGLHVLALSRRRTEGVWVQGNNIDMRNALQRPVQGSMHQLRAMPPCSLAILPARCAQQRCKLACWARSVAAHLTFHSQGRQLVIQLLSSRAQGVGGGRAAAGSGLRPLRQRCLHQRLGHLQDSAPQRALPAPHIQAPLQVSQRA